MKLAHKIYVVIAIFTIPLMGLTAYFMFTGLNDKIDFATQELAGNIYMRPLSNLLEHISQHQLLSQRALGGETAVTPAQLADVKVQINQDFSRLGEVDEKYGKTLQFTKEALEERKRPNANVTYLRQQWQALAGAQNLTPAESRTKHSELIGNVLDMVAHAGDKSNLILDPDLDSYYMMDMTLIRLPVSEKRITQAADLALDIQGRGAVTPAETRQLDTHAAMLREVDSDNVIADMKNALQEDANFSGVSQSLQKNLRPKVDAYTASVGNFASLLERISTDKSALDRAAIVATADQARKDSFQLWDTAVAELDVLLNTRIAGQQQQRTTALLAALGILLIAGTVSYFMIRTITRSIDSVAQELHELASGEADLTRRITVMGSQELQKLAQSYNTVMGKLLELIRQVQQSGTQVTSSSTQIAASTKQLEAAVTEQAASTNEVVATTKEISATSQTLVQTMGDVGKVAQDTSSLADTAQGDLDGMASTMKQLAGSTTAISSKLAAISEKASNINKIVITITKVADQTNLLSLNASIEAEKAGEHGLGFAVVAREIRRLADQTAVATLDIERMVKEMQSAVSTGVMEMDKFTKDVNESVDEVSQIGQQLTKIMDRVQALAPRFETVTEGMQAQSQGAGQINSAMVQLSEAARQTMDSLRQTNSAITDLNSAARGLHSEVSRFRTSTG